MLNTIYVGYNIHKKCFIQEGLPASREYITTGNIVFNFLDG
jgi:hypothetical protein